MISLLTHRRSAPAKPCPPPSSASRFTSTALRSCALHCNISFTCEAVASTSVCNNFPALRSCALHLAHHQQPGCEPGELLRPRPAKLLPPPSSLQEFEVLSPEICRGHCVQPWACQFSSVGFSNRYPQFNGPFPFTFCRWPLRWSHNGQFFLKEFLVDMMII